MPTNQAELLRMETQSSWVSLFPGVSSLPRGSSCSGLFPGGGVVVVVGSGGFGEEGSGGGGGRVGSN